MSFAGTGFDLSALEAQNAKYPAGDCIWERPIEAYQTAHEAAAADQIGIDLLDPAAIDRLTESALSTPADLDTSKPTQQMAMVADVLWHSITVAKSNSYPAAATTNEIIRYVTELASYTSVHG